MARKIAEVRKQTDVFVKLIQNEKDLEEKKKREEEERRRLEEERRRLEEARRKAEEEKKRQAEIMRRQEEEERLRVQKMESQMSYEYLLKSLIYSAFIISLQSSTSSSCSSVSLSLHPLIFAYFIVLVWGAPNTGKTFFTRGITYAYSSTTSLSKMPYVPTIGVEFGMKVVNYHDKRYKLQCWDLCMCLNDRLIMMLMMLMMLMM